MSESQLQDIIAELTDAESKLNATITKIYGKVETTDFAAPYLELQDVLKKLIAFSTIAPVEESAPVQESEDAVSK